MISRHAIGRSRARKRVDDAAEQPRLEEVDAREREVREREQDRKTLLGREQAEHTQIDSEQGHRCGSRIDATAYRTAFARTQAGRKPSAFSQLRCGILRR